MRIFIWIFFIISVCFTSLLAQSRCQGEIVSIKGTGTLTENGKVYRITSKNYNKIKLISGQVLKTNKNGDELRVKLDCVNGEFSVSVKPYKIPGKPEAAKGTILDPDYWKNGGGNRNGNGIILFPIESDEIVDVVRPESVVLRWATSSHTKFRITLVISQVEEENEIWKRNNIVGNTGSFTSDDLKRILGKVQRKVPNAKFKLTLKTTIGTENFTIFRIFSLEEEKLLQKELNELRIRNRIARAQIYARYNLFIEAANECEADLRLSPKNINLLKITSIAQAWAGNLKRRDELDKQIRRLQ
jgi:hypothetical protein